MRRWAFIVMVVGMFFLLVVFGLSGKDVDSYEDLESLEVNSRVFVSGRVVEERFLFEGTKLFELENGVELVCECSDFFEGQEIEVEGVVSEFEGRKQVRVLEITS